MEPRSSALNTGDRAASTARCAWMSVSPPTEKDTSEPSGQPTMPARCAARLGGGTAMHGRHRRRSSPSSSRRTTRPHTNVATPSTTWDDSRSPRLMKWCHPMTRVPPASPTTDLRAPPRVLRRRRAMLVRQEDLEDGGVDPGVIVVDVIDEHEDRDVLAMAALDPTRVETDPRMVLPGRDLRFWQRIVDGDLLGFQIVELALDETGGQHKIG
uniref:Uncharacterized protein n=1 Tax=Oryza glumipatula TaxID=40148 RepID=A0A0E0AXN3_9ORYZ